MRRFATVFQFELKNYVKNKSFMITTILIALVIGIIMFIPNVIDLSDVLGVSTEKTLEEDAEDESEEAAEDKSRYGILDTNGYFADTSLLEQYYGDAEFVNYKDEKSLKAALEKEEVKAGFVVEDDSHFQYLVWNNHMFGEDVIGFQEAMTVLHKQLYCQEKNLDFEEFAATYDAPVEYEQVVLGKDASDNYWYSYALVIVIFMIIVMYCVMIATSVTSEKSNRAIEVLVTSIDSKYLLFGKVLSGALAAILQVGIILATALVCYQINRDVWGGALDPILHIPGTVLWAFAMFGIGGFLFYAFLYGALGALVSKTEDVNKSISSLQMIVMIVYFIVLFSLDNVDGILIKVCSFLPISSYSAMFVRIAMGNVEVWEIAVSFVILVVSTIGVGWLAAKIYRMGTLRYGNPISIKNALKSLKND